MGDVAGSPLGELHLVHTRIARTMEQLDNAFVSAYKLGVIQQISASELQAFISSMGEVEANLQKWVPVFAAASLRPPAPLPPWETPPPAVQLSWPTLESPANPGTPAGSYGNPFSTPLTSNLADGLDSTPVEAYTPSFSADNSTPHPELDSPEQGAKPRGETSPLPPTPSMLSPPKSCFVLKNRDINASSSSFTITPSSASPRTPVSFHRDPLSVMGHNLAVEDVGLVGKQEKSAEDGQENETPVCNDVEPGLQRLPDEVESHTLQKTSLHRSQSANGTASCPAQSPFRTPGVNRLMRLSPGGPSPVSPVQNLSFDTPATFATWHKKTRPRGQSSDSSPELRTPEMESPPATTELEKINGPDLLHLRLAPLSNGFEKKELEIKSPVNPFDFPDDFAPTPMALREHSPSKGPPHPMDWVGRKTVDVAEVMRGDDVAAGDWKDGVAALRGLNVSKSATLPRGIDPLEVDVRPDFEPMTAAAALLAKKGFGSQQTQEAAFGVEGSPGWMDGRLALKAYGLDSDTAPSVKTARVIEPSRFSSPQKGEPSRFATPQKSEPSRFSPEKRTWEETKLETVGEWVEATAADLPGAASPNRFLGFSAEPKAHRRSRSHDLGPRGLPRSDLGFCSPRGPQKGEWAIKELILEDSEVINDGKENINPNVGSAMSEATGLDLSAFPAVFRTGEGAQQLLTVFQQFPAPRIHGGSALTGRDGSLSLSDLDSLLVGYGTERLSLLLDLLASRGVLQPFVVGRQMRWERPPEE